MSTGPAFVPANLGEAEGRTWRSFYPRQVRGLIAGALGGGLGALLWGVGTLPGFMATMLAALPGFAYGFYLPGGRPVEWWLRVYWRYYTAPQRATLMPRKVGYRGRR